MHKFKHLIILALLLSFGSCQQTALLEGQLKTFTTTLGLKTEIKTKTIHLNELTFEAEPAKKDLFLVIVLSNTAAATNYLPYINCTKINGVCSLDEDENIIYPGGFGLIDELYENLKTKFNNISIFISTTDGKIFNTIPGLCPQIQPTPSYFIWGSTSAINNNGCGNEKGFQVASGIFSITTTDSHYKHALVFSINDETITESEKEEKINFFKNNNIKLYLSAQASGEIPNLESLANELEAPLYTLSSNENELSLLISNLSNDIIETENKQFFITNETISDLSKVSYKYLDANGAELACDICELAGGNENISVINSQPGSFLLLKEAYDEDSSNVKAIELSYPVISVNTNLVLNLSLSTTAELKVYVDNILLNANEYVLNYDAKTLSILKSNLSADAVVKIEYKN